MITLIPGLHVSGDRERECCIQVWPWLWPREDQPSTLCGWRPVVQAHCQEVNFVMQSCQQYNEISKFIMKNEVCWCFFLSNKEIWDIHVNYYFSPIIIFVTYSKILYKNIHWLPAPGRARLVPCFWSVIPARRHCPWWQAWRGEPTQSWTFIHSPLSSTREAFLLLQW